MSKLLSVIIANRNDTAMLSVTVSSCIEELRPLGLENCEIIICDNSDSNIYPQLNSCLPIGYIRDGLLKIFRQDFPCLFSARETAIEKSSAEYIICLDSHMIVGRDMFVDLVNFMEAYVDRETVAFAHAPVNWSYHHESHSVHDRDMSKNELGDWNKKYDKVRTITWKGMPWICRRSWFLDRDSGLGGYGALSQYRISWGGGDMHIGIKPWLLGFKNWAVPCNAGVHIGPFPEDKGKITDYKYRLYSASGLGPHTVGFLVSCYILGGDSMIERNRRALEERFGAYLKIDDWIDYAKMVGKDEKAWLDERKVMSFEELLEKEPWNDGYSD